MKAELIDNQTETDETYCELWSCDNIYTRCDGAWSCLNGSDESNCKLGLCSDQKGTVPCMSPYNFTQICLPISRANDGIIDCLGASDERSHCRWGGWVSTPYKCWNDSTCISEEHVCEAFCAFEKIKSQCYRNIQNFFIEIMQHDSRRSKSPIENYFIFEDINSSPPQSIRTEEHSTSIEHLETRSMSTNSLTNSDRWKCNRGIPIETRTTPNYRCFCPPSYYGDHCQFQSQRVSLTLQMHKICAPSCRGVFGLVVTLVDHEQTIHSQEQLTYIPIKHCGQKFHLYLLYNQRPKNLSVTYILRVDVYDKIEMSHHASWILPIPFPFLPVNRIATLLTLPAAPIIVKCSKICLHGHCSLYVNTDKEFCLCQSGWSGERCDKALDCTCSADSRCLNIIHNRSTCLCPLHKSGPRCFLSSICQSDSCSSQNEICVPFYDVQHNLEFGLCLCSPHLPEQTCINTQRMQVSFAQITIPQILFAHVVENSNGGEPVRRSTSVKIRHDQDEAILDLPTMNCMDLLFLQVHQQYFLAVIVNTTGPPVTKLTLDPSRRCPHIRELLDKRILSYRLLRRAKYYHTICKHPLNLSCFHDEEGLLCLCTKERHASCLNFDFQAIADCQGLGDCENGATCVPDRLCPTKIYCVCTDCFYGSRCQFTTRGFGLSLDAIFGYSIRPYTSLTRQPMPVKISVAVTIVMFVIGLTNGILSTLTFRGVKSREVGCGYYLLTSSIISLFIVIVFTWKFVIFLLSQMSIIDNRTFLYSQCLSIDFILRSCLALSDWLNAAIALERALAVVQGTKFNKRKSCRVARYVIITMTIVTFASTVHDPLYRQVVEDERVWCLVQYPSWRWQVLNVSINIVHFVVPFFVNIVSTLVVIIGSARQRASAQKQRSYRQHLLDQWRHHNHLLFSSLALIVLATPRLIISFLSGCMTSPRHPGLFLLGYFVSFIPPLLTIAIYVLPSETYRKEFYRVVGQRRTIFCRQ